METSPHRSDNPGRQPASVPEPVIAAAPQPSAWEFQTLLDSLPQAVMFVGADGRPKIVNDAVKKIIAAPADVLMRMSLFDMQWDCRDEDESPLRPDDHPVALALTRGITVVNRTIGMIPRGADECRWFAISAFPRFTDGSALPAEALVVFEEITGRKFAEQALHESEERFQRITETITDYIYTVRFENGSIAETVHGVGCRIITGYSSDDFKRNPLLWIGMVHPGDRERVKKVFDDLVRMPYTTPVEHRIVRKDGVERWVRNTLVAHFGSDGSIVSYDGVVQDITDRKLAELRLLESEKRYRELFETSLDGIAITDIEGRILDCNLACLAMLGCESTAELISRSFCDLSPVEYHDLDNKMISDAIEKGYSEVYENELLRKNGERFFVNIRRWLRLDANGNPAGQWVIARDISEKKKMDAEMMRTEHLRSLSQLAGGIAHDFNNLLGGIFGYMDIAREFADSPDKLKAYLDKAIRSLGRARDLTERLLTFSKGDTPARKLCSVAVILNDAVTLCLAGQRVRARMAIDDDCAACELDAAQIGRVVNNILVNAVQAMPDGGAITVTADNFRVTPESGLPLESGNYVRIAIGDMGTGIPGSIIDKVFDPFFTTKPKGTGLGLAICLSIMRKHDGHIAISSREGKGTVVHLYLPASDKQLAETAEKTVKSTRGHGRILVMDDEEFVLDIATQMLTGMGYSVDTACHGEEAVAVYLKAIEQGTPFDAVVLDLTIPGGMGGVKTCERLRAISPAVKVIASSGYSNDPVMAAPADFGFVAMLKKPYIANELSAVLKRVLKHQTSSGHPASPLTVRAAPKRRGSIPEKARRPAARGKF